MESLLLFIIYIYFVFKISCSYFKASKEIISCKTENDGLRNELKEKNNEVEEVIFNYFLLKQLK